MPALRDKTMLKPDSRKFLIAMAESELDPVQLAQQAEISVNVVYIMRRGYYVKPKYLGAAAKALNVKVADLLEDVPVQSESVEYDGKIMGE